jgi:hypothetical protein
MPKTTRVLHNEHEYLIVDERPVGQPRSLTFLVRPDDPAFKTATAETVLLTTLGKWSPIGVWEADECRALSEAGNAFLGTLNEVAARYFAEATARTASQTTVYYFATVHSQIVFSLTAAQPDGLTARLFTSEERAKSALADYAGDASLKVESFTDLYDLLFRLAEQGFAGAVLDDREPIYFCSDADSRPQFLLLRLSEEREVEQFLLRADGTWAVYEGELELELFSDQDSHDHTMTQHLGQVPFFGYAPGMPFFAAFAKHGSKRPLAVADTDGDADQEAETRVVPIFFDLELAEDYLSTHDLGDHELRPLENLYEFIEEAERNGQRVVLQPEGHRARSGSLWTRGQDVILDSFSGFWSSADRGAHFEVAQV